MEQYEDEKYCSKYSDSVAIRWYKQAAENGKASWLEQENAARLCNYNSYCNLAFSALKNLYSENQNNGFLEQKLGDYYRDGRVDEANETEANKFYKLAFEHYKQQADAGEAYAMAKIGDFFRDGKGCKPSNESAILWYEKAAEIDSYFQYKLENMKSVLEKKNANNSYDAIHSLESSLMEFGL